MAQASSSSTPVTFTINIDRSPSRIEFLKEVVPDTHKPLLEHFATSETVTAPSDDDKIREIAAELEFADALSSVTDDNLVLTKGLFFDDPEVKSLKDVARKYNHERFEELLKGKGEKSSKKVEDSSASVLAVQEKRLSATDGANNQSVSAPPAV